MSNFIHRWLNPHCPDCLKEKLVQRSCDSCETLRGLLESEKAEKQQLLDSLLHKEVVGTEPNSPDNKVLMPKRVMWNTRRMMLEQESRQAASLLKKKETELKNTEQVDVSDLEEEMGIVEKERENAGKVS